MNIKVGDRVECVRLHPTISKGMTGEVVEIYCKHLLRVSWDNFVGGHSCGGLCKHRTGWNVHSNYVKVIGGDPNEY